MNHHDLEQFEYLLSAVEACYRTKYPSCSKPINEWTGNEIAGLQEDLREEAREQISEKWFYTHIKTGNREKLPRIDVLNMLSRYCGYKDWQEFTWKNQITGQKIKSDWKKGEIGNKDGGKSLFNRKKTGFMLSVVVIIILFIAGWKFLHHEQKYSFCFYDADKNSPLINVPVEVIVLKDNESPIQYMSDSSGCFEVPVADRTMQFIVKAAYYKTDTIKRNPDKSMKKEIIKLKTDDFALMIHIFSRSDVDDWKSRRMQLDEMINDNAKIFQIDSANTGMEMYNKTEFIDKMTMPLNSLKNVEILETVYKDLKSFICVLFRKFN
jgi:hypothetical protein